MEQDADSAEIIATAWHRIARTVNKILEAHKSAALFKLDENLNPSLKELLYSLALVDTALTTMMSTAGLLSYEEFRQAINSKQCILHIRRLAAAVDNEDQVNYNDAIHLLESQSKF